MPDTSTPKFITEPIYDMIPKGEHTRLMAIEAAAKAYDEFVLAHGEFKIRKSHPLLAQRHLLHKDLHDALATASPHTGGE